MGDHTGRVRAAPDPERFLLCLPTYDERENLPRMIAALEEILPTAALPGDVLVIDDNSPDGTGRIADELAATRPWLHVMHRPGKGGLGRAYLAGFRWALENGYAYVLEMDCDFSHDPAVVPRLVATAGAGADLVLGSRYVEGGGTLNWGLVRRLISSGGCLYARLVLGLRLRDLTGGFKCFHRTVLEAIDLDDVRAEGYAFQVEMTYRASLLGFRVVEVPIVFTDRVAGGSKMSRRIVAEAAWRVPLLRLRALLGRIPSRRRPDPA
jgi:dolichol-phosphate mannosyltransferase